MSVPTAELRAPSAPVRSRELPAPLSDWFTGGRLYVVLAAASIAIGAFSLLIPSTPSYDPWAWLVWGREIVHLKLHTTGGPTWKPLPVIFTTLFAPFGKAQPDLWLVIARAGALMAVAMAFRFAWRITAWLTRTPDNESAVASLGGESAGAMRWSLAPALLAALISAAALVVSRGFISDNALGYSEGLMTAIVLIAVERHLDGARRQAFAIGFFAALDRPELWLLWGPYGLYLWWKDPGARKLVIVLFALIPVLWFLPEYWGSGHFFRGVSRAQHPRSNSPAFAKCPFCTELAHHAWAAVLIRVKAVAGLAMLVAAVGLWRVRRPFLARGFPWLRAAPISDGARARALLVGAGLGGLAWWVLIALLTQAGFSGNDRYLVLGAALIGIAGGVGWGWGASGVASLIRRLAPRSSAGLRSPALATGGGVLAAAILFLAIPPRLWWKIPATHRALVYQAHLREDMTKAVQSLGGPGPILRCGTVMTEGFQVPMLAWTLGVHTLQVEASPVPHAPLPPPPNVIFQTRAQRNSHLLPVVRAWTNAHYRLVARVRTFRVYAACHGGAQL